MAREGGVVSYVARGERRKGREVEVGVEGDEGRGKKAGVLEGL